MKIQEKNIVGIVSESGLARLQEAVSRDTLISLDTETGSLDYKADVFLQIAYVGETAYYIDRRVAVAALWRRFGEIVLEGKKPILCHNAPFDLMKLRLEHGIRYTGDVHDTLVQAHLLDENSSHRLKDISERTWGPEASDWEKQVLAWLNEFNGGKKEYNKVPADIMVPYACQDVLLTRKLHDLQYPKLAPEGLLDLYNTERELIKCLVDMRCTGVRVDVQYLNSLIPVFQERMAGLEAQIHALAGKSFNVESDPQLAKVLYQDLGLKPTILTENGKPSTDKEALAGLKHPIADLILEHRDKGTSLNTFILPWIEFAGTDGYLHPSLNQTGARSGRFTCSNPNCQQIAKRSESANVLRRAFVYPDGRVGGSTDQSQIELVGFAHYSGDPIMRQAIIDGKDLHKAVIVQMGLAKQLEDVTKDQRQLGKGLNFSIVFGVGKGKLSSYLSQYAGRPVSPEEAADMLSRYRKHFPAVEVFKNRVMNAVKLRADHCVKNMFGRKFRLSPDKAYIGINRIVQGWASDTMKYAMVQIWKKSQGTDLSLYLNIHDDLRWTCEEKNFPEYARMIDAELSKCPYPISVPMRTETTFSRTNWAEEEVYKL